MSTRKTLALVVGKNGFNIHVFEDMHDPEDNVHVEIEDNSNCYVRFILPRNLTEQFIEAIERRKGAL